MIDLYKRFTTYKVDIEGKSPNSISHYIYMFDKFATSLALDTEEKIINANIDNIKAWLVSLSDNEISPSSRNASLTAIKEIYKYLHDEEDKAIDIKILNLKFAKVPIRETKYLNKDTAKDYILSIGNLRTKAMSAVIFATGVRFCELSTITIDQINNGYANIIGKGNKERTIYFSEWCLAIINKYIERKRNHIIEEYHVDTNLLFISDNGNPISKWGFTKSLKYYGKRYNENPLTEGKLDWWQEMSPHKLRHSFATAELDDGIDMATVRDSLGHANIYTTNRYVHSEDKKIREAMLRG